MTTITGSVCTCGAQAGEHHLHDCPLRQADASAAENIWNEEHGIPTRDALARDLLAAPGLIAKAEADLRCAREDMVKAKDALANQEAHILIAAEDPKALGGNAEQRAAKIRLMLTPYLDAVRVTEHHAATREHDHNFQVNWFRALRSVAGMLAGEER